MRRQAIQKQKVKASKIPLRVKFLLSGETCTLGKITTQSSIRDLKSHIELATGIPFELQQLSYLDAGDLPDDQLFSIGVTQDSVFQTATSEYMLPKQRRDWLQNRAAVALFIACHRSHYEMARRLIQSGASANCRTGAGRSPLHVAAAMNNCEIVDLLLENGADIDLVDLGMGSEGGGGGGSGRTAIALAAAAGHKSCERRLFMHRWEKRAYAPPPRSASGDGATSSDTGQQQPDLFEFQRSDSSNPRWRVGPQAQVYMEAMTASSSAVGSRRGGGSRGSSGARAAGADREPTQASSISYDQWRHRKTQQRQKVDNSTANNPEVAARSRLPPTESATKQQRQHRQQQQRQAQHPTMQRHRDESLLSQLIDAKFNQSEIDHLGSAPIIEVKQPADGLSGLHETAVGRRRGLVDPQLNAYEQWLKDRSDGDATATTVNPGDSSIVGAESMLLPYQLMIEEFCREKCSNY